MVRRYQDEIIYCSVGLYQHCEPWKDSVLLVWHSILLWCNSYTCRKGAICWCIGRCLNGIGGAESVSSEMYMITHFSRLSFEEQRL